MRLSVFALAALAAAACSSRQSAADLVLTHAHVYTMRWPDPGPDGAPAADAPFTRGAGWHPDADAIAIRDSQIVWVGKTADDASYIGPRTKVVNVHGETILPGFVLSGWSLPHPPNNTVRSSTPGIDIDGQWLALESIGMFGYTTVEAPLLSKSDMKGLSELAEHDSLPIRVYGLLSAQDTAAIHQYFDSGKDSIGTKHLEYRAVELVDPAPAIAGGAHGGYDSLAIAEMMKKGWQVVVDAHDAAAAHETFDWLQRVMSTSAIAAHSRPRIDGLARVDSADLGRFISVGATATLGPGSLIAPPISLWRSLRMANARLTASAATPKEPVDGLRALRSLMPALTIDEAVRAMTRWPAFAEYHEGVQGMLAPGYRADMIMLPIDPFIAGAVDLARPGPVSMTIVAGRVVYAASDAPKIP